MKKSLENALAYCREKVCGRTSSLHYATLFEPEELKAFWLGCFTLNHELRQACLKQLEAGLTQVKLGWWQNALADTSNHNNPHPVMTAISMRVIGKPGAEQWAELINKVARSCEPKRYENMADWHKDVRDEIEPWVQLIQARFSMKNMNCVGLLMFWTETTRLCQLLRLAKYLAEGFQPLPISLLSKYGVTAEQIKKRVYSQSSQTMFVEVSEQLVKLAEQAWKSLPAEQRIFARPLRALFRMRVAELKLHKSSGYKLLTEQKMITPLKKFSIAWTTQVLKW